MSVRHLPCSVTRVIALAWLAALLALCCGSAAHAAAETSKPAAKHVSLAGTWKGSYGGAFSGTFTLRWTQKGSHLTGTIKLSNPKGTYNIGGSVTRGHIKFGAVAVGATYTGKVSGKTMSGTYKSPQGGGPWSAHKT